MFVFIKNGFQPQDSNIFFCNYYNWSNPGPIYLLFATLSPYTSQFSFPYNVLQFSCRRKTCIKGVDRIGIKIKLRLMKAYLLISILQDSINEDLYLSTNSKELSSKDIQDLADLFSGKIKCRVKQVYTHNPIINQIPMADDPDPDMFSCPEWLKDHNQAIAETHALGLYAESIKKGDM